MPSLRNIVSSLYQLLCSSFRHRAVLMCSFALSYTQTAGHVVRSIFNSLDCWSFKTFNHGLNISKILTARQFCDFWCLLFLFRQSSAVKPVWAGTFVLSGNETSIITGNSVHARICSMQNISAIRYWVLRSKFKQQLTWHGAIAVKQPQTADAENPGGGGR